MDYDVAVIGGGPGGYVAAIRAAQLGARVLLVERDKLGGVCLNRGCIPTKTLLKSAEKWRELQNCAEFGLQAEKIGFDYRAVTGRMTRIVRQLQGGIGQLVKSNAIAVAQGEAALGGPGRLKVAAAGATEEYSAGRIIVATGSVPFNPPVPGSQLPGVINSDQLLAADEVPRSMIIVGGGAVGIEFAMIFQSFGCQVTVVEMLPAILPGIDGDLVKRLGLVLRKSGVKMLVNTRVTSIRQGEDGIVAELDDGSGRREVSAEKLLMAAGRRPAVAGLNLEAAGVEYDRQGIKVNEKMATTCPGIYAIGDVTGRYMWAHAASTAGMAAAENALGGDAAVDFRAVPGCVYTTPEIAAVGLTEEAALAAGQKIRVSRFNFAANGKAVSMGEADGLVKIVAAEAGQVLGMHILGPHASDLIMEGALAIRNGLAARDIAHTIHPHPSLSETVMECAHGVDGDIIHQVKR